MSFAQRRRIVPWLVVLVCLVRAVQATTATALIFAVVLIVVFADVMQHDIRDAIVRCRAARRAERPPYSRGWEP